MAAALDPYRTRVIDTGVTPREFIDSRYDDKCVCPERNATYGKFNVAGILMSLKVCAVCDKWPGEPPTRSRRRSA